MKKFFFLFFLAPLLSYAQNESGEQISNIQVRYRSVDDSNRPPVSVNDIAYDQGQIEMEVSFTVLDVKQLKEIEIKTGEKSGSSELLNKKGICYKDGDKYYFIYDNTSYEIIDNKVTFTDAIPEYKMKRAAYFTVNTVDRQNKKSLSSIKKIN